MDKEKHLLAIFSIDFPRKEYQREHTENDNNLSEIQYINCHANSFDLKYP